MTNEITKLLRKNAKIIIPKRNKYVKSIIKESSNCTSIIKNRKKNCKKRLFTKPKKQNEKRCYEHKFKFNVDDFVQKYTNLPNHTNLHDALNQIQYVLNDLLGSINNECFSYVSQLQFNDLFYFLSTKISNKFSNTFAISNLKNKNIAYVTAAAIIKKRDKVNYHYFENMFTILFKYVKNEIKKLTKLHTKNNFPSKIKLCATDGTTINFCKMLKDIKLNLDKGEKYNKGLVNTIYDVTNSIPIDIDITENMSEPSALIKQLDKIPDKYILLADAHYLTGKVFDELSKKNIKYIGKISKNYSFCKKFAESNNVSLVCDYNEHKIRLVKNIQSGHATIIATNLLDTKEFTNELIIEMYENRWFIEEFYKTIKCTLNIDKNDSIKGNNIMQDLYVQMMLTVISKYVEMLGKHYVKISKNSINTTVNQKNLIYNISNDFMYNTLYKNFKNKKIFTKMCNLIFDMINQTIFIIDNRHNQRVRNRPHTQYITDSYRENG